MARGLWWEKLNYFKGNEHPEAVLLVAGNAELARIAVAWKQTAVHRRKNLSKLTGESEEATWNWLWENVRYDRAKFLTHIPNANVRTEKNLDALIASRVLYPDGSLNTFVERYLRDRVVKLFSASTRKQGKVVLRSA